MQKVSFHYADVPPINLKNKKTVKAFIASIFSTEGFATETINYIFCSDEYLLTINQDFLKHNYFTDIITFDLSVHRKEAIIGEIYISIDRVKENAIDHSVTFQQELLRVLFHGALHLCGYKDKKKSEITLMREKEDHYLCLFEKHNS